MYVCVGLLVLVSLLYVWSNFVVRDTKCPLCDVHRGRADRAFGPVHVCTHLQVKETSDAGL